MSKNVLVHRKKTGPETFELVEIASKPNSAVVFDVNENLVAKPLSEITPPVGLYGSNVPSWLITPNAQTGNGFTSWANAFQDIVNENIRNGTKGQGLAGEVLIPGFVANATGDGVVLLDGRVLLVGTSVSNPTRIYDPVSGIITNRTSGASLATPVLLKDGRVVTTNTGVSSNLRILNPWNSISFTNDIPIGFSISAMSAGIMLADGRVYFVPSNTATTGLLYDPTNNTFSVPSGTFASAGYSLCLLPDGKVLCLANVSTNSNLHRLYDPELNQLIVITNDQIPSNISGCCLMLDGKVFAVPRNRGFCHIFDPATLSYVDTATGAQATNDNFSNCTLMPDGRILLIRQQHDANIVYDPVTDSYSSYGQRQAGNTYFRQGLLLRTGDIFLAPGAFTTAGLIKTGSAPIPNFIATSPFLNKH